MIYVVAAELAAADDRALRIGTWLRQEASRWAEPLPNLWIVEGAFAAEQIMRGLEPLLEAGDLLMIVKAATEAVWHGRSPANARWLAGSFPGSLTDRIPDLAEGTR